MTPAHATRASFLIAGFASATWAALVPFAKARLALGDGELGALLLCLGVGSILTMPISGALTARFGCRRTISVAALAIAAVLPALASVTSVPLAAALLAVFGAALGALDVAMNVQAILVQRAAARPMMSGFHGLFSVGGIAGAGGMTALLTLGRLSPVASAGAISVAIVVALALAYRELLPYGSERSGPAFAVPHGIVLAIGAFCFVLFLVEGAILDWGGVFLTTVRHLVASDAGLGYAAFAATMTAGRLFGDRIVARLGRERVVVAGALCAAAGFLALLALPAWQLGIAGCALVGAGCSNIVPVLYSAVGDQREMPESIAVPATTTIGYAGILAGPASIGLVAQLTSLEIAFLMLVAMLVAVALGARVLRRVAA